MWTLYSVALPAMEMDSLKESVFPQPHTLNMYPP